MSTSSLESEEEGTRRHDAYSLPVPAVVWLHAEHRMQFSQAVA